MLKSIKRFCVILAVVALIKFSEGEKVQAAGQEVPQNSNICQFQPNGALLDNPEDCQKFYLCVEKQAYEYNCNPGYFYDATRRHCVKGTISCSSGFNRTALCDEGVIRSVQNDCNVFEACVRGVYQKLNCPLNYYFNAQKSICVPFKYDAEYKCNCLMPEYTVLENKNNCETYIVCHHKSAIVENCPLGQYYNAELNTCLVDLEGVCLMKPTVLSLQADQLKKDTETKCKSLALNNIHFKVFPIRCNTFYICLNGQLSIHHCPKNFYYDTKQKLCSFDATNKCLDTEDTYNN